jgi:hypothetical protein
MTLLIRMPQTLLDHDLSRRLATAPSTHIHPEQPMVLDLQQASTKRLILAGKIKTSPD